MACACAIEEEKCGLHYLRSVTQVFVRLEHVCSR